MLTIIAIMTLILIGLMILVYQKEQYHKNIKF